MIPIKTNWMEKQMQHEPSKQYGEEIYSFVKSQGYKNALEIGSAWGISTLAILSAGKGHLTSVDPDKTKAYDEVEANGFQDRWTGVMSRSAGFWQSNEEMFDLIYIDGSHLFQDVYDDLFEAWKVLKPGGMLLLDDYTHKLNKDIDVDAKEPIFGISYALCCFIGEKDIRQQRTTMRIWTTIKAGKRQAK